MAIATLAITMVVNALFGAVVLARTYRKRYGWYFALTLLGIILWSAGDLIVLFAESEKLLNVGAQLFYISPMIIPVFIWFFAISFPENRPVSRPIWWLVGSMLTLYAAGFLFNLDFFIRDIQLNQTLNVPVPNLPGFMLYAIYFSLFFTLTYITFYRKMYKLKGANRLQVGYTLLGALIASVPALVTNLSLPLMGHKGIIWLGPFFTLFFAAAVTVAIARHRLFDIRPVIVRSLGYAITIITVAIIYGFVIFGLAQLFLDIHLSLLVRTILAISTGVAVLLFQNLKAVIDKYTKRLFYRDAYDPQVLFDEYNKALVSTIDLDLLLKRTSAIIIKHLKAEFCHIGVKDGSAQEYRIVGTDKRTFSDLDISKARVITPRIRHAVIVADDLSIEQQQLQQLMRNNNVAVLVRLTTDFQHTREGLGYLVLGQKKSGNQYTKQDLLTIETLANELIIALQNALRFEEIERFNETLQQRVEDATVQLRRANKRLKELNESKDDFIGMASHQLRTPLTSIKGYVSLVMDGDVGKVNDQQRQLLRQAFVSSQRMVFLIADLLNVSRLRTGKFIIERSPTDLSKLITDELAQLEEAATIRDIELAYYPPAKFPLLPLDETKTRQVIMNFIDNAIYYTPRGGHIKVELKELPKSVELRVVDDGIGVPKSEWHNLFTKFYRAKNAQRARPDGTGLGLFMAKKVIVAQGGAIIFSSKEGEGSTFGFSFPKDIQAAAHGVPEPVAAED